MSDLIKLILSTFFYHFLFSSMVSSYLVHHGYCATATAFARATETMIQEDQSSIKNRQSEWTRRRETFPASLLVNRRLFVSCRNTEAGPGGTGGRSHRGHSAGLPGPVRTQPEPALHVEVSGWSLCGERQLPAVTRRVASQMSSVCGDGERHRQRGPLLDRTLAQVPGQLPRLPRPQPPPRSQQHTRAQRRYTHTHSPRSSSLRAWLDVLVPHRSRQPHLQQRRHPPQQVQEPQCQIPQSVLLRLLLHLLLPFLHQLLWVQLLRLHQEPAQQRQQQPGNQVLEGSSSSTLFFFRF